MSRLFALVLLLSCILLPLSAQSDKLIKELESKRAEVQKQIAEQETILNKTKKNVSSQMGGLATLTGKIEERKRYILSLNHDMESIDSTLNACNRQLKKLETELLDKKKKYEASVQYLHKNRSIEEKLMFIFSAENLAQTYRRFRYVQEYAAFQRMQGEELLDKQKEVNNKKQELQKVRAAKEKLLKEREAEKVKLEAQEKEKRQLVNQLKRKQQGIQAELRKKRRQANQLNSRIDKLIAAEIEKARKRAEAEARKEGKSKVKTETPKKGTPMDAYKMTKADRELSTNFNENRGRLPMPISGPYIITSHYGQYNVEGLRNVKLDNKGIDIQGKPGAKARAIFNGKVAAVFKLNGLVNILIRHGAYISVYCNLSSASVKQGDTVSTKQEIGTIFSNKADGNRTVLHFQLRREKEKLNPEPWLNR